ncbi:uncharacterized protein LOC124310785 [Daphnia pulicaria]|uniref:uncharacterized protein LOC124310785 n=1 Tax=Daphnia pulicaria TaxID=35523 RepID=UPI001EEA2462|nr:uncharacterized protein LOC124310785 [Daphnia pulicaria]
MKKLLLVHVHFFFTISANWQLRTLANSIGGGEEVLLKVQNIGNKWHLITFSLFCDQLQFIQFDLTKNRLRFIGGLIYQAFVSSQVLLTILMAILELAEVLRRDTGDATFWIFLILNMLTFTAGLFWFNILIVGLSSYLSGLELAKVYEQILCPILLHLHPKDFSSAFLISSILSRQLLRGKSHVFTAIEAALAMLEAANFAAFLAYSFSSSLKSL